MEIISKCRKFYKNMRYCDSCKWDIKIQKYICMDINSHIIKHNLNQPKNSKSAECSWVHLGRMGNICTDPEIRNGNCKTKM